MSEVLDSEPVTAGPVNPFAAAPIVAAPSAQALVAREVGEVHAAVVLAKSYPRDEKKAVDKILVACGRTKLAASATYEYPRGGESITGPSIRLAEVMARAWGNLLVGVVELSRSDGKSEALAYAWDLETNFRDEKRFQVKHWRDTKKGGYAVTDERDVYEIVANVGARRKRACILAVIPGDVVETALDECERTLKANIPATPENIKKIVDAFAKYGVTVPMIEKRFGRRIDSITPGLLLQLLRIGNSLRDGMSLPSEWFEMDTPTPDGGNGGGAPAPANRTEAVKDALRKSTPATDAPAPHETTPVPAEEGKDALGATEDQTGAVRAEDPAVKAEREKRDAEAALADRIVTAAKKAALFSKGRKIILGQVVAESLGLEAGEHGAADLVEKGCGEEVAIWLESQAPGGAS